MCLLFLLFRTTPTINLFYQTSTNMNRREREIERENFRVSPPNTSLAPFLNIIYLPVSSSNSPTLSGDGEEARVTWTSTITSKSNPHCRSRRWELWVSCNFHGNEIPDGGTVLTVAERINNCDSMKSLLTEVMDLSLFAFTLEFFSKKIKFPFLYEARKFFLCVELRSSDSREMNLFVVFI